jgi:hypothetical protein
MTRRRRTLLAVGLLIATAFGGIFAAQVFFRMTTHHPPGVLDKICVGMTRNEVVALIAWPPDRIQTSLEDSVLMWRYDGGYVGVTFDRHGVVINRFFSRDPTPFLDRLRRALRL